MANEDRLPIEEKDSRCTVEDRAHNRQATRQQSASHTPSPTHPRLLSRPSPPRPRHCPTPYSSPSLLLLPSLRLASPCRPAPPHSLSSLCCLPAGTPSPLLPPPAQAARRPQRLRLGPLRCPPGLFSVALKEVGIKVRFSLVGTLFMCLLLACSRIKFRS